MTIKVKIKIDDDPRLRHKLDNLYQKKTQIQLARWAIKIAKHVLDLHGYDYISDGIVSKGFAVNEAWQVGKALPHDVRQAGFKIHRLAKNCGDKGLQIALRTAGQAVGTGHMREHALVASDYAIKAINIKYPSNRESIRTEREWQINTLDDC